MFLLFMLGVERVPCAHSGFIWTGCVWGAQRQWGGGAGAVGGGGELPRRAPPHGLAGLHSPCLSHIGPLGEPTVGFHRCFKPHFRTCGAERLPVLAPPLRRAPS